MIPPALLLFVLSALATLSQGQEYVGNICQAGTPFCWVPIEGYKSCDQACANNKNGSQVVPVTSGDFNTADYKSENASAPAAGGKNDAFPHWVCRAMGDRGEGWRAGFNLKGFNDGTQVNTSCSVGAHQIELLQLEFECQCAMPFPAPAKRRLKSWRMNIVWLVSMLMAAMLGSALGVVGLHFAARTGRIRAGGLSMYTELPGLGDIPPLKMPLHHNDGL